MPVTRATLSLPRISVPSVESVKARVCLTKQQEATGPKEMMAYPLLPQQDDLLWEISKYHFHPTMYGEKEQVS